MAHLTADRVKETTTTTGTGAITLAGAMVGFRAFSSVLAIGDTCYYSLASLPGAEWEVGIGTYSALNTLTRTTVLSSSNAGAAVTFSAGTKEIFITAAASRFLQADSGGNYGVGTNSPGVTLDVNGPSRVRSDFYVYGAGDRFNVFPQTAGNGINVVATNNTNTAYAPLILDGSYTQFRTSGGDKMRLDVSGNLLPSVTNSTNLGSSSLVWAANYSNKFISSNSSAQSLTDGAAIFNGAAGAILIDDGGHKRISWNDAGGNFNIRAGNYYNATSAAVVYAKGVADTNSGAATITLVSDSSDGSISMSVASIGVPGATVAYSKTLTLATTGMSYDGTTTLASNFRFHLGGETGTGLADIRLNTSTKNLVISAPDTGGLYLNFDHGTGGVIFSNGAAGTVGTVSSTGVASFSGTVTGTQLISNIATGTAPLAVTSTTLVTNLNADLLDGLNSTTANTASTIVARDSSGGFSAGTITAVGGIKSSDTVQPSYQILLDFGADTLGTWRKIITATLSAGTQYSTHGFRIRITDPNANHATQGSVNVDEVVYYVACVRSEGTVIDTPDLCVVRGPASHVRAVKLATGSYEIQVQPEAQYREYLITIESYATNGGHTIVYSNGSAAGSAGTATYSAAVGGATTWVDKLQSTGTITSAGTITTNSELVSQGSAARLSLYRSDGINYFDWSSGQSLYFSTQTSAGGAGRSTKMVLDDGGNLGIGATSPTNYKGSGSPAFVVGNTRQIGLVSGLGSLGVYGSALTFNSTIATDISPNTFTVLSGTNQKGGSAIVSNYDGKLTFYVYDAGAETGGTRTVNLSTAERMSIDASGNVTPGTTNTQTLGAVGDVWSNVYATTFTGALTGAASLNVLKAGDTMTGSLLTNIGAGASSSTKHIDLTNGTGYDLFMLPRAGSGSYNGLTVDGDAFIGFSAGAIDTGGLVIGPWSATSKGLRISSTGATTGTSFNGVTGLSAVVGSTPGTAAIGTSTTVARSDHVHPIQTTISGNAGTATRLSDATGILRISNPGGATFRTGLATDTGAIKIKLPTASFRSATMMQFTVKIYEYAGDQAGLSRTIIIGGYNYSDVPASWFNIFAHQIVSGAGAINVRFGNDGTSQCVWIGETNTVWNYPQVAVIDFQGGHSNFTDAIWGTGWAISAVTAFDTVTQGPIVAGKSWNSTNDGAGSGLDADLLDGLQSATANTVSTIVARDASGNFSAGTITAALSGNASTATSVGSLTGIATVAPLAAGTAAVGTSTLGARQDHVHPVQTTVSGNAGTATTLATARTISLTGDVTGSVSFNGSADVSITAAVVDDSHNHTYLNSSGSLAAETLRAVHKTGIYSFNSANQSLGDSTPISYWSTLAWGAGAGGSAELAVNWTSSGNEIWFRSLRDTIDNWWTWKEIIHSSNYNSYSPTLTGTGASGTWSIGITGNAATLSNFLVSNTTNNGQAVASNYVGYVSDYSGTVLTAGVTDGALYNQYYSGSWQHQIYGDYRTGQIAVRGKNNGTWQAWRTQLDSSNYNSYAPTLTGTGASGTWGISVTGSAASAGYSERIIYNDGPRDLSNRLPNTSARTVNFDFVGAATANGSGNYGGVMTYSPWSGTTASTGDSSYQLAFANLSGVNASGQPKLSIRNGIDTTWNAWYTLLHSGNYNSYALPLSGGTLTGALAGTTLNMTPGTTGVSTGLTVINGDITTYRSGGTTGVIYLSNSGTKYLYWDGTNYAMPGGQLDVNSSRVLNAGNYSSYALPLSGGSVSGNITFSNGRKGLIGQYDATQTQAIFAMGSSYILTDGGASNVYGNFYGLAWSYNPDYQTAGNNPQSKAGLNHQLLLMQAGVTTAAIGVGVWTSGSIIASGNITAYSDESLKTNWQNMPENFVSKLAKVKHGIYDRLDGEKLTQVGVSAQSLREILPEAVIDSKEKEGTLSVAYGNAALASAVELAIEVVDLRTRVAQLEEMLNRLIKE